MQKELFRHMVQLELQDKQDPFSRKEAFLMRLQLSKQLLRSIKYGLLQEEQ